MYIHTCIPTYIHTYIHAYIRATRSSQRTYICTHTYIHTRIRVCIYKHLHTQADHQDDLDEETAMYVADVQAALADMVHGEQAQEPLRA